MLSPSPSVFSTHRLRRGLTLVEMLVSLVCVLLLMMAYTQLFSDVGSKVGESRSMIELTSRMRSAAQRLHADLEAHTCDMKPWQRPEAGAGYFEYIEGPLCDKDPVNSPNQNNGLTSSAYSTAGGIYDNPPGSPITNFPLGDTDDVLMFTVRSKDGPFTGRYTDSSGNTKTVQSEVAEIVWFLRPTMMASGTAQVDPPTYTLYRRVFLVMPTYNGNPVTVSLKAYSANPQNYDVSMHYDGTNYIANTLGDLTKRECRVAHTYVNQPSTANGFPHKVDPTLLVPFGGEVVGNKFDINKNLATYARYGEDVVLTNVLSFDVQAWDPTAPVQISNNVAVGPSDTGYKKGGAGAQATGAYVDLAYDSSVGTPTTFSGLGNAKSQLVAQSATLDYTKPWLNYKPTDPNYKQPATFDTWSFHYEMDGLAQVSSGPVDPGTDQIVGIQTGSSAYETSPPYPVPLRGLRVRIRCYEPDARDVREVTVTESFVPE